MRTRAVGELKDAARVVLSEVQLAQIFLASADVRASDVSLAPPFRTETELRVAGRENNGEVQVWANYVVEAFKDGLEDEAGSEESTEGSVSAWSVNIECVAAFARLADSSTEFTDDQLEAFGILVGAPALHPYAREWAQTYTGHTRYPAFTMGLMESIAELSDEHEIEFDGGDN